MFRRYHLFLPKTNEEVGRLFGSFGRAEVSWCDLLWSRHGDESSSKPREGLGERERWKIAQAKRRYGVLGDYVEDGVSDYSTLVPT